MFRLRVKGSPKTLYEFLETCSGVEAEAYILVNDTQTLISVIQQAITRNLVVEIIPAVGSRENKPGHVPVQQSNEVGNKARGATENTTQASLKEPKQSKILKKYREKTSSQKEHEAKEKEEEQEKESKQKSSEDTGTDTVISQPLSSVLGGIASMVKEEEEITFDELIRLKEEAFSRKLME